MRCLQASTGARRIKAASPPPKSARTLEGTSLSPVCVGEKCGSSLRGGMPRKFRCGWGRCALVFQNEIKEGTKNKQRSRVGSAASVTNYMLAAGERTAQEPCLIASNLNFTSLQKSHRDSLQVMTSSVCVVRRDYIHPGHLVLLPHAEPTLHAVSKCRPIVARSGRRSVFCRRASLLIARLGSSKFVHDPLPSLPLCRGLVIPSVHCRWLVFTIVM